MNKNKMKSNKEYINKMSISAYLAKIRKSFEGAPLLARSIGAYVSLCLSNKSTLLLRSSGSL
jgi:hypothetical protein